MLSSSPFKINGGKVFHYVRQLHSSMSPFEVVQPIQSAGVGVVGLDLRRTVVVLRSVDDQDVGETVVIRFRFVSQRIEKFGGSHEGKVKRHPVTSATVARIRIDDERAGPPPSLSPGRVKPKIMQLVFVASPLST